jgi:hypothetical protein
LPAGEIPPNAEEVLPSVIDLANFTRLITSGDFHHDGAHDRADVAGRSSAPKSATCLVTTTRDIRQSVMGQSILRARAAGGRAGCAGNPDVLINLMLDMRDTAKIR